MRFTVCFPFWHSKPPVSAVWQYLYGYGYQERKFSSDTGRRPSVLAMREYHPQKNGFAGMMKVGLNAGTIDTHLSVLFNAILFRISQQICADHLPRGIRPRWL